MEDYETIDRSHVYKGDEDDPYADSFDNGSLLWDNAYLKLNHATLDPNMYTFIIAVWLRINSAAKLSGSSTKFYANNVYTRAKLQRYCDNHLRAVQYLDGFDDPSDANIDVGRLCALLGPLGDSHYSEDRGMIKVIESVKLQQLPTPLEVLTEAMPSIDWNPMSQPIERYTLSEKPYHYDPHRKRALKSPQEYTLYIGCILVLDQLHYELVLSMDERTQDALHYYYVAFVDLFWFCINHVDYVEMTDKVLNAPMTLYMSMTAWEMFNPYVSDTRAFHAGDLPDFFSVVTDIPLYGEQHKSSFTIGKILQKSYPFCGQMRKLIEVVRTCCTNEPGFWYVFNRVFWCLLAGMYPGDKCRPSMKELLRIKQLTDPGTAIELLNAALTIGEYDGSALIMFTAFRRYIIYMAKDNVHYVEEANKCIDWAILETDTLKRAELIRSSNLFPADPFGRARILLTKMHKNNSKLEVYRYRSMSCIKMLAAHCNNMLEKTVYKALHDWRADDELVKRMRKTDEGHVVIREMAVKSILWDIFNDRGMALEECLKRAQSKIDWNIAQLENDLTCKCKEAILNMLIKIPVTDRLKPLTFGLLRLPRYGGITIGAVECMNTLVHIYSTSPMPSKFYNQLRRLNVYDFKVICCFFNVLMIYDKINLVAWDADTVRKIDSAMMHKRNILFPGQKLPAHTYDVVITVCCARVATFEGRTTFGHKAIAYDIDQKTFVCSKKKGKKNVTNDNDLLKYSMLQNTGNSRRMIRNQRKDFIAIPCDGQPVIRINLRGFHLVWGNERDKRIRYCHCPECGSFHQFKWSNYEGSVDASYRCDECKTRLDLTTHEIYECSYCLARPRKSITRFQAHKTSLYVMHPEPEHMNEPFKLLYFCKKHHGYARTKSTQVPKNFLWAYIHKKEAQRRLRAAMGYFR